MRVNNGLFDRMYVLDEIYKAQNLFSIDTPKETKTIRSLR